MKQFIQLELPFDLEVWRDIEGYEGLYQVSNFGNVRSIKNGRLKVLKPVFNSKGYHRVCLCKYGKIKNYSVHRLVLSAFVPNTLNLPQINHKNEIRTDNRLENLEWCDAKYNCNYGNHSYSFSKSKSKRILCIETGEVFDSVKEASNTLKCSHSLISQCLNNKIKTAYGYHWRFVS